MKNQRSSAMLSSFINDCRYRNLSVKAIADYEWYLNDIKKRCGNLMEIDRNSVKQLVMNRLDSGLSPVTVNHYIKAIKVFYSFLFREELIENNTMAKLEKLKEPKRLKPVLDEKKIARLISAIPAKSFFNVRDRAMITLIWDTAMRLNELLSIELANVDLQFKTIKIVGKGDKERMVPFRHA